MCPGPSRNEGAMQYVQRLGRSVGIEEKMMTDACEYSRVSRRSVLAWRRYPHSSSVLTYAPTRRCRVPTQATRFRPRSNIRKTDVMFALPAAGVGYALVSGVSATCGDHIRCHAHAVDPDIAAAQADSHASLLHSPEVSNPLHAGGRSGGVRGPKGWRRSRTHGPMPGSPKTVSDAAFQPPVRREVRTICSDAIS